MLIERYKWQPVIGKSVIVYIEKSGPEEKYKVFTDLENCHVGNVFLDKYSWRWQRYGINEVRGARLSTKEIAVSELLFNLRKEDKI